MELFQRIPHEKGMQAVSATGVAVAILNRRYPNLWYA